MHVDSFLSSGLGKGRLTIRARNHSTNPAVEEGNASDEEDCTNEGCWRCEGIAHDGKWFFTSCRANNARVDHAKEALADDQAGCQKRSHTASAFGILASARPAIVEEADDATDGDQNGQRGGQIHAHAHSQRRQSKMTLRREVQNLIDNDDSNTDDGAQTQQTPVLGSTDDTLCERRNQRGLRSSKRVSTSMRFKTGGMISAPKTTPMTKATCCFHGVAFTS